MPKDTGRLNPGPLSTWWKRYGIVGSLHHANRRLRRWKSGRRWPLAVFVLICAHVKVVHGRAIMAVRSQILVRVGKEAALLCISMRQEVAEIVKVKEGRITGIYQAVDCFDSRFRF